jgi:transposase
MHLIAVSPTTVTATVACDVSAYKLNLICRDLSAPGAAAEWEIANRTEPIIDTLTAIWTAAAARGITTLRVVVEPTGIYHKLLLRIAASLGFETALVDAGHVTKMRSVLFGDDGKTDERDPYAIEAVAAQGRLIADRRPAETYQLLRQWGKLYHDAEVALIDAKSRVHRVLTLLFPDFAFSTDFLYSPSGRAIFLCFAFNPHTIAALSVRRLYDRLRKRSTIRRSSVQRLVVQARQTIRAATEGRVSDLLAHELALAWHDLELAEGRRENARLQLERLYDEARTTDPHLPDTAGSVLSKAAMARFLAETGPLSDYRSWRQLMRMGGVNLRERKSGKYVGQTRIARTGRPLCRAILNQMALPLVKRDRIYGPYYHHKTAVQKMPGSKAMTAVARKILKMIWGWYRSGRAFDASRVFQCEGQHRAAA